MLAFLLQPTRNGGECQEGYFCPEGSYEMTPCTAGMHCNTTGLALPVDYCDAGWYCPTGSSSPRERVCPQGYYCPVVGILFPVFPCVYTSR